MPHPVAFKVTSRSFMTVHAVSLDPSAMNGVRPAAAHQSRAVLVVRDAPTLANGWAGLIDPADIVATVDGDWSDTILVVLNETSAENIAANAETNPTGDEAFIAEAHKVAPALAGLARQTLNEIRASGVEGTLVHTSGGRWKNAPRNTFTLKVQPRAGNLQFTLYGNPGTFDAGDFLRQDQNSYSRGWVSTTEDAMKLAKLVRDSHSRRS